MSDTLVNVLSSLEEIKKWNEIYEYRLSDLRYVLLNDILLNHNDFKKLDETYYGNDTIKFSCMYSLPQNSISINILVKEDKYRVVQIVWHTHNKEIWKYYSSHNGEVYDSECIGFVNKYNDMLDNILGIFKIIFRNNKDFNG